MGSEVKVIPDRVCAKLRKEALKNYSLNEYIDLFTSNLSSSKIEFSKYKISYEQSLTLLKYIYEFEHMDFGSYLKENSITPSILKNRYLIPISTATDWFNGRYPFPEYIKLLLCDTLNLKCMPTGFYTESQNVKRARYKSSLTKAAATKETPNNADSTDTDNDFDFDRIDKILNESFSKNVEFSKKSRADILVTTDYLDSILKK